MFESGAIMSLVGVALGWLLTELSYLLRLRREDRRALGRALTELLEIRHTMVGMKRITEEVFKHVRIPDHAQLALRNLLEQAFPNLNTLHARFDHAVTEVAARQPILAFRIRSQDLVSPVLRHFRGLASAEPKGAMLWKEMESAVTEAITPHLEGLILNVARLHSWRTWFMVRRYLKKPMDLPPTFQNLLSKATNVPKPSVPQPMTRMTYEQIIAELAEANKWLTDLGLRQQQDRIRQHMRRIEALEVLRLAGRQEKAAEGDEGRLNMFALTEAMEFIGVFHAFRNEPAPILVERLKDVLSGHVDLSQESSKASRARNVMFELNLASRLRCRGLPVELPKENPDIRTEFEGVPLFFQCKRPYKEDTIPNNIEKAAAQLERDLDQANDPKARGIIAISVSRVFNPGKLLYRAAKEAAVKKGLGDQIEALGKSHRATWSQIADPRIVGIAFHIITPTVVEDIKLLTVGQSLIIFEIREGPERQLLARLAQTLELNS